MTAPLQHLLEHLRRCRSVLLACSGGVDSVLLLDLLARETQIPFFPVFIAHPALTPAENAAAAAMVRGHGGLVLPVETAVMTEVWGATTARRCYRCKRFFFTRLRTLAVERGLQTVCDGTHAGDNPERPGRRALAELGVVSPLLLAGWDKPLIRRVARERGLEVWKRPAAACLAVAVDGRVTGEKLDRLRAVAAYLESRLPVPLPLRLGLSGESLLVYCRPEDRPSVAGLLTAEKLPPPVAVWQPLAVVYRPLRGGALV